MINLRHGIFLLSIAAITATGLPSCNLKPDDHGSTGKQSKRGINAEKADSLSVNERKPRIVKDERGNMTERYDVTLCPTGEIQTRNEYHYTYDDQNHRTSELIWRRSPEGALISRSAATFIYDDSLLRESTFVSYDSAGRENNWLQSNYLYDNKHRETTVTTINKNGLPVSKTERIYNDKGNLWKEISTGYDGNSKVNFRSGLEYDAKGAVIREF